jgi:[ribosomal protein S18]-alanine N-acetyltransferase
MELRTRRAVPADLPRVMAIERASFSAPWSEDSIASELAAGDPRRLPWVAELDGVIVAFALVWVVADELHLVSFAVDPAMRRRGIGQLLLDAVLDTPEAKRASIMTLEVRATNRAALALYRRNGFLDIALRPRYYPDTDEDAVVMLKPLGSGAAADLPEPD